MGKYTSHQHLASNAPHNWRDRTTSEQYLRGMSRIAPPGMKPKAELGSRFEDNTDQPRSAKWHHNWDMRMFGGTCIPQPGIASKQMAMEELVGSGQIPRIPDARLNSGHAYYDLDTCWPTGKTARHPVESRQVPVYKAGQEGIEALWAGAKTPPYKGQRVDVLVNDLGTGIVDSYFIERGWLGVKVLLDNPPQWHRRQNPDRNYCLVFGTEIRY